MKKLLLLATFGLFCMAQEQQLQVIEHDLIITPIEKKQEPFQKVSEAEVLDIVDRTDILKSVIKDDQTKEKK